MRGQRNPKGSNSYQPGQGQPPQNKPEEKSFYEILNVDKNASTKQIKDSWRKLVLVHHPDKLPEDKKAWGEEMIKEINEAYEVLSDPEKKKIYDQFGKEGLNNKGGMPGGMDINDLFPGMFGMGPGMGRQQQKVKVPPVQVFEDCTLEELYKGKHVTTEVERYTSCVSCDNTGFSDKQPHTCTTCKGRGSVVQVIQIGPGMIQQAQRPCNSCHGSGNDGTGKHKKCDKCNGNKMCTEKHTVSFDIPPGLSDKDVIVIENEGNDFPAEHKTKGRERGKIHVIINEKEHELFKHGFVMRNQRNPANLAIFMKLTLAEALCGFKKEFQFLDGRMMYLEENDVIKDGEIRIVVGEGMPHKNSSYKKGNLVIKYEVEFPSNLTYETKEQLHQLLTGTALIEKQMPEEYISLHAQKEEFVNSQDQSDDEDDGPGSRHGHGGGHPAQCAQQ